MPKPNKLPHYTDEELNILRSRIRNLRDRAIFELVLEKGWRISDITELRWNDLGWHEDTGDLTINIQGKKHVIFHSRRILVTWLEFHPGMRGTENPYLFVDTKNPPYTKIDEHNTRIRINTLDKSDLTNDHRPLTRDRQPPFTTVYEGLLATQAYCKKNPKKVRECPRCHSKVGDGDSFCDLCSYPVDPDWQSIYQRRVQKMYEDAAMFAEIEPYFSYLNTLWMSLLGFISISEDFIRHFMAVAKDPQIKIPNKKQLVFDMGLVHTTMEKMEKFGPLANKVRELALSGERQYDSLMFEDLANFFRMNYDEQLRQLREEVWPDLKKSYMRLMKRTRHSHSEKKKNQEVR